MKINRPAYLRQLLVCLCGTSALANAYDLGTHGPTYAITEPPFVDDMQRLAKSAVDNGKWASVTQGMQTRFVQQLNALRPVATLNRVATPRSRLFDPSIVLTEPLSDQTGRLIHRAGTRVNPLDVVSLSEPFLLLDADDDAQVKLAMHYFQRLNRQLKIIVCSGNYLALAERWPVAIFADQRGEITARLSITALPVLVQQQGNQLLVEELVP